MTELLDGCLLTDAEMSIGPEGWAATFEDPFTPWVLRAVAEPEAEPTQLRQGG